LVILKGMCGLSEKTVFVEVVVVGRRP
jgi:hypothetical protein